MSKVKLSEIGTFKNGLNFSAERVLSGCKMIGVPDFGDNYLAKLDGLKEVDEDIVNTDYLLQDNDILFVRSNGNKNLVGRAMLIEKIKEKVTFSGFCIRFRITNNNVNPLYMLYLFKSPLFRKLFSNTQQTSISNLNQEILGNIEVELPTIGQQNRIVKVIHGITRKIENNKRINDNLEQQAKLLYDYWFTQFDFPDESEKPYRSSGGKMVWNEQLKMEIPFSWVCSKMENAIEAVRTGLNPRNNFKLGNGNIQYITVKNLCLNGSLDFSGCDTIDEQAKQIIHRRSDIQIDDILFASIAPLGRCYLIQENPTNWDINESVFSIRYNSSVLTAEYLYMNLQSEAFVKRATACSTGSIFKGIRINSLMDSEIILPPLSVTKEFSKEIKPLFALQKELDRETHTLIQLRDWLLPVLMNGQATISD